MELGCVACGNPLLEGSDRDAMLCKTCVERRDAANCKQSRKVYEWQGRLDESLSFDLEPYIGKLVKIEVHELIGENK